MTRFVFSLTLVFSAMGFAQSAIPSGAIPQQFGVNIHFTEPRPGEMEMIQAGGFRWVRMDFNWGAIEHQRGQYDFSHYDNLIADLEKRQMHALLILDYSNHLYDQDLSPHTDEGRAAFAAWAAVAVKHFKGHGILWEMYNEPNGGFWKPKADVDSYTKLAIAVGKALREAEPTETYIGPATSGVDLQFIEACFKAGCLEYWSAVSVHPYRQNEPESAAKDYRALRSLIARYAPVGKQIPIISGEWGYSSVWHNFTPELQGKYISRELLCNLWQEVPLSIWYDWHEDGMDPKEPEHHFGTVLHPYQKDQKPVYEPKPAYIAIKAMTTELDGFTYNKRLAMNDPVDFVLLFDRPAKLEGGRDVRLAVWTVSKQPREVVIPASAGRFSVVGNAGESLLPVNADEHGLHITVTDSVQYVIPDRTNEVLGKAAAWERLPLEIRSHGSAVIKLHGREITIGRSPDPVPMRFACPGDGAQAFAQSTALIATDPLILTLEPCGAAAIRARLQNPAGEAFTGHVSLRGPKTSITKPVELKDGQTEAGVDFTLRGNAADWKQVSAELIERDKAVVTAGPETFASVSEFEKSAGEAGEGHSASFKAYVDGNAKVKGEATLSVARPPDMPPAASVDCLRLTCNFAPGWKFLELLATSETIRTIDGKPKAYGLWVYGDADGGATRIRFADSTGQTFQSASESVIWKGWRYIRFSMTDHVPSTSHWGGADDGIIHYPIHWDAMFLLDKAEQKKPFQAEVYLSGATLIY